MIFNKEEGSAWMLWATDRRQSGKGPSDSIEAFISGYRLGKKKSKQTLGWEVVVQDAEGYSDRIFELDVGFEYVGIEQAIAHVKDVCDYTNPIIISCVRKVYE